MHDETSPAGQLNIVVRKQGLGMHLRRQLSQQLRTQHERFLPAQSPYPDWTSYSSQQHVCDMSVDSQRGCIWLATWGGILCWMPDLDRCVRHTSEHGLPGNATRTITVDQVGTVWAGSQDSGLVSLAPGGDVAWQMYPGLLAWSILRLAPRPQGGVYAALRDAQRNYAVCEVAGPDARPDFLVQGGLMSREIEALLIDREGCLWIGNAWGLYRRKSDGSLDTPFNVEGLQVHALAEGIGGVLWVGTNQGICRFRRGQNQPLPPEANWPRSEIVSLSVESNTGDLWVATTHEVGRIVDNSWQLIRTASTLHVHAVVAASLDIQRSSPGTRLDKNRVWAGGAQGLYAVNADGYELPLGLSPEDTLSNAVHCLWADEEAIWVGTTRGLYRFAGQTWHRYDLEDVRALLPGENQQQLLVGTWPSGLQHIKSDVHVPGRALPEPIVALARTNGTVWIATPEAVYERPHGNQAGKRIPYPARNDTRVFIVKTLCHQILWGDSILWVGTSAGLFRYRPKLHLPEWIAGEMQQHSISALAVDPTTGYLWVGTSTGLFSEPGWQCHLKCHVRALTFGPDGTLWLGTTEGLEHWPAPGQRKNFGKAPLTRFTSADSGLAAKAVTSLAIRTLGHEQEVWVGSAAGVSCYRHCA